MFCRLQFVLLNYGSVKFLVVQDINDLVGSGRESKVRPGSISVVNISSTDDGSWS